MADKAAEDPAECGRVGGWVASFDKLLADPLGVHTLLVSLGVTVGKTFVRGRRGLYTCC